MTRAVQYSVHAPSQFIGTYWHYLLPEWSAPITAVLIILQACECSLLERTAEAEAQKQWLRQQFLHLGHRIASELHTKGYQAELFDPRTGLPLLSRPGELQLDDVAVVQACLGYPTTESQGCSVILHPTWGSAVYPSTVVSSAAPELVAQVTEAVWTEVGNAGGCLRRSECHQSCTGLDNLTE